MPTIVELRETTKAGPMDNPTFFQAAMTLVFETCDKHDTKWQKRRRKISSGMIFSFLVVLGGISGIRETLAEFELEKKVFLLAQR